MSKQGHGAEQSSMTMDMDTANSQFAQFRLAGIGRQAASTTAESNGPIGCTVTVRTAGTFRSIRRCPLLCTWSVWVHLQNEVHVHVPVHVQIPRSMKQRGEGRESKSQEAEAEREREPTGVDDAGRPRHKVTSRGFHARASVCLLV